MFFRAKCSSALGRAHDQIGVFAARHEIPPVAVARIRSVRARATRRDALLTRIPLIITEWDDMRNVRVGERSASTDEQKAALQTGPRKPMDTQHARAGRQW